MIAFKFLAAGAVGPFTGYPWPTPGAGPGAWVDAPDEAARRGVHACRVSDLAFWLAEELWVAELRDPVTDGHRQVVASSGRLLERVSAWNAAEALAFAEACAWRTRDLFVAALIAAGREDPAERLGGARDLGALGAVAHALRGSDGLARGAGSYLRDAIGSIEDGDAPVSAYISARGAVVAADGDERAFAAEREAQGLLLARRLGLLAVCPAANGERKVRA